MSDAPRHVSDPSRLRALRRYEVVDTPPEEAFDRLTDLASHALTAPIALLTFVDAERQWHKSRIGTDREEIARSHSFCARAIETEGPTIVPDLSDDPRFADNPFVTGAPHLRFYAGAPVTTPDGHRLGTICILDTEPRSLSSNHVRQLEHLADLAMETLEGRQYAVEDQEELSQTVLDHLPGLFYVVGPDRRLKRWNAPLEKAAQLGPDKLEDRPVLQFFEGEDRARIDSAIDTVFEEGAARLEADFQAHNGDAIPMRFTGVRVKLGDAPHLVGMAIDVSERQRQARARAREERKARRRANAMEVASDGMAILDPDGTYAYVNQAHAKVYGYDTPDVFLGRSWKMCYDGDELRRFEEEVMPTLHEEGEWRGEAVGQRADGGSFPQSLTLTLLEDGGIICVVRDITRQKKKEQALREAKREAEEANRMKSAFLAHMSHEIRTPLTSIIGFAEAIGEEVDASAGELVARFARLIEQSGHNLLSTLDSILNLSQLEAGEMELENGPVNLTAKADKGTAQFSKQAQEQSIALSTEPPADAPVWARADEGGLQIVLRNLISNALKYTNEGGSVTVRTYATSDAAVLEVEDTGVGMDPETVPEMFDAFRQGSEGVGREYGGTGLGLAVTRQAVDQMNGTIDVETEPGTGTRFTVRLPLSAPPTRTTTDPKEDRS